MLQNIIIIFEDKYLLALDKPSGWITNDASTTGNQPVVQNWVAKNLDTQISKNREYRNGIVHRLDKETSGVLLIAKTKDSFDALQKLFKERKIQKTYLALVHGVPELKEGTIDMPVGRLPWRRDRFGVLPDGRNAVTDYKVKSTFADQEENKYSLVEAMPKTGRTHQIRIHLKYLGHPIVADEFYAGRKTAKRDRKVFPRMFLHAYKISFIHPFTHKKIFIQSELPKDLKSPLDSLKN